MQCDFTINPLSTTIDAQLLQGLADPTFSKMYVTLDKSNCCMYVMGKQNSTSPVTNNIQKYYYLAAGYDFLSIR